MFLIKTIFFFLFSFNCFAATIDKIVAIVNDEIITEQDLSQYKKTLSHGKFVDDLLVSPEDKKNILKDRSRLIDQMINERLLDSEVSRQDLSVTFERVDQEINTLAKSNGLSRAQLLSALKKEDVLFSEYQQFIKQRLERQSLIQKVVSSKIKITDDDVQNYYLNNYRGSALTSYEYSIAHILFLPKNGDKEGAKNRATDVLNKLKNGASFSALASQYSEDPNFTTGGYLGSFKSNEFSPELEAAVKPLSPGETSSLVASKTGYHILKLLSKKIVKDPEFESKKQAIQNILYEKAFSQQFKFWIEQKRAESFIKIN